MASTACTLSKANNEIAQQCVELNKHVENMFLKPKINASRRILCRIGSKQKSQNIFRGHI